MPSALAVSGEVAGAGAALAGLILVFLGAIANSFDSYERTAQTAVRGKYQRRAWFAFVGFVLCLLAVGFAIAAEWLSLPCAALVSVALLVLSLVWVLFIALAAVLEIK